MVKKTGEVLNVAEYAKVATDHCNSWGNPVEYSLDEIEIIPDEPQAEGKPSVDWGQRRYEIARDCLASSFCEEAKRIEREFDSHNYDGPRCKKEEDFIDEHASKIVRYAIRFADELIKKLKGE